MQTEHLYLRPWDLSDAKDLYKYAKDPDIGPSAGWPPITSIKQAEQIIDYILTSWGFFALVLKDTQEVIGCINILIGEASNFDIPDTEGELGFWIGKPFWGCGYITEAVDAMLTYAFKELDLPKVWCGYFSDNIRSKRLQEKCGFQYSHTLQNVKTLTGEKKTEIVTYRLKPNIFL